MRDLLYFFIFCTLFCSSCSTRQAASLKNNKKPDSVTAKKVESQPTKPAPLKPENSIELASITYGSCFGSCPVYAAKLYASGKLVYIGKKNVSKIGLWETIVGPQFFKKIIEKATELGYFSLENKYPVTGNPLQDLPTTTTSVRPSDDGSANLKKISNNFSAPKNLLQFERFFDELLDNLEWKEVKN